MKTIQYKNGNSYKGDVDAEGLPHGYGCMDYKLNGCCGKYKGQWEHGKRSGTGHYYEFTKAGARHTCDYEGEWLNDMEHGQGVATKSDERGIHLTLVTEVYTGTFRNGKRHGKGTVEVDHFTGYFTNGVDQFDGEFADGKKQGHGTWHYANGDTFECEYDKNWENGHGKYTFKNGLYYEGDWKDGCLIVETFMPDPSIKTPALIVEEHHHGFDYTKQGRFLIIAKKEGFFNYKDAAHLWNSSLGDDGKGIDILELTADSVSYIVRGCFMSDSEEIIDTIHRGETKEYVDERKCTATIYGDDYDYTIDDSLKIICK